MNSNRPSSQKAGLACVSAAQEAYGIAQEHEVARDDDLE